MGVEAGPVCGRGDVRRLPIAAFLLAAALQLPGWARGQSEGTVTLQGTVHEKGSRKPVAGAMVNIVPAGRASTDRAGVFVVDSLPAGTVTVRIAAMGYRLLAQDIALSRTREARTFGLEPDFGALTEIPVVAKGPEEPGLRTISRQELKQVPSTAGDPLRAVTTFPGVSPASDIDSNLYVRGSGPNDNAMYVDGIIAGYPYHYQGLASTFQSDALSELRFYSGGFPERFGNRMGGIFDIRTRELRESRLTGTMTVSLLTTGMTVESPLPWGGMAGFVSARQGYGDFVIPRSAENLAVPRFNDYLARVDVPAGGGSTFRVEAFGAEDSAKAVVKSSTTPDVVGSFDWHHAFHVGAVGWKGKAGGMDLDAVAGGDVTSNEIDLGQDYFFNMRPAEAFARAEASKTLGQHTLAAGVEGFVTKHDMDLYFTRLPSEGQGTYSWTSEAKIRLTESVVGYRGAVWCSERWAPTDRVELGAGLRTDGYTLNKSVCLGPHLSGRWKPLGRLGFFAVWGVYYQAPQTLEVIPRWGNPELAPNRARHTVVGAEYGWREWTASLEVFDKRFDQLVVPDAEEGYANKGSGFAQGLEVLLRRDFSARVAGWLAYSRAVSMRRDSPDGEMRRSDYDIPDAVSAIAQALVTPEWLVSARWRRSTGAPYTPVLGEYRDSEGNVFPRFGEVNSARLPCYDRLDLRTEYGFRFEQWTMAPFIEVLNVLGKENLAVVVWSSNYNGERRIRQIPRIWFAGTEVRF